MIYVNFTMEMKKFMKHYDFKNIIEFSIKTIQINFTSAGFFCHETIFFNYYT